MIGRVIIRRVINSSERIQVLFLKCLFWFRLQTEGDGNCLLQAVLGSCEMEDYFEGLKYGYHQLRLQFVNHMVQERDILYDELVKDIKMCYGGFEDCETFTYKTYCQKMMQNKVWCDIVALKVIASMWAAKITVINADNLYRTDIRHEGLPQDADIVLLFNANYINGHYVSCLKTDGTNFMIGIPEVGEGYRRNTDRIERKLRGDHDWIEDGEEELICIPMSIYRKLIYKSEQYDKMKELQMRWRWKGKMKVKKVVIYHHCQECLMIRDLKERKVEKVMGREMMEVDQVVWWLVIQRIQKQGRKEEESLSLKKSLVKMKFQMIQVYVQGVRWTRKLIHICCHISRNSTEMYLTFYVMNVTKDLYQNMDTTCTRRHTIRKR